jgi:LPXTG-motif cell wall-anchored protein
MNLLTNLIFLQYRTGSKPETGAVVIGALILGIILYFIKNRKNKN